jgi:hypothetical protein
VLRAGRPLVPGRFLVLISGFVPLMLVLTTKCVSHVVNHSEVDWNTQTFCILSNWFRLLFVSSSFSAVYNKMSWRKERETAAVNYRFKERISSK